MSHQSKDGVDKFMAHVNRAISLRETAYRSGLTVEGFISAEARRVGELSEKMRQESDEALKHAEYMLYELIDKALDNQRSAATQSAPSYEDALGATLIGWSGWGKTHGPVDEERKWKGKGPIDD